MSEFVSGFFAATTADDERDYFTGAVQRRTAASLGQGVGMAPGTYRVIDGALCRVLSGLPEAEVRQHLSSIAGL